MLNKPIKFKHLLYLAVLAVLVSCCQGCSRSTMLFRGKGDLDYYYQGGNSQGFPLDPSQNHKHE